MSGNLPHWLAARWGVAPTTTGEGAVWSLSVRWPFSAWLTLLLAAAAVAWIVVLYRRETAAGRPFRRLLTLLRLAALALVAVMISQLTLALSRTGLPHVAILVDDSASQQIVDRDTEAAERDALASRVAGAGFSEPTRLNQGKTLLLENDAKLLREVAERYRLKLYYLSSTARGQSGSLAEVQKSLRKLPGDGQQSRLGAGLRSVLSDLRGAPPSAVLVFTDGVTTEGETLGEAAAAAARMQVPIYAVGLGSEQPPKDLVLSDLVVDDVVFVDDLVQFEFKLAGPGFAGREVEVALKAGDDTAPLQTIKAKVTPEGQPQSLRLTYRPPTAGEFEYRLEIAGDPNELQGDNNQLKRTISVRQDRFRVLLAWGYPSFEYRFLKHLLERDPTIEVQTLLQEADPQYAEDDKTALRMFPVREDELFAYDVLILGDLNPAFLPLSLQTNITEFVTRKGGGVILVAGTRHLPWAYRQSPLAELLPFDTRSASLPEAGVASEEGAQLRMTELGLASPPMQLGDEPEQSRELWGNLPPLFWMCETPKLKPAARVLAEHPTRIDDEGHPQGVLVMQFVGPGRVLFHATDETWRWRRRVGDALFARYWVQTIRYLSRAKLLGKDRGAELTTDRLQYETGESPRFRLRFLDERLAPAGDDAARVVIEQPGRPNRELKLRRNAHHRGVFEGVAGQLPEGRFHAFVAQPTLEGAAPTADFQVVAPPGELERTQLDAADLRRAADETGGRYYTFQTASRLLHDLPEGRQVPIERLPPIVLWNRWPILALVVALLGAEWWLRKRKGML